MKLVSMKALILSYKDAISHCNTHYNYVYVFTMTNNHLYDRLCQLIINGYNLIHNNAIIHM